MPKPRRDLTGPARVVLYTRGSTGEQADSGAGLAAQESQLRVEAEGRGWLIVGLLSDAAGVRLGGPQMVPTPIVARIVGGRRAGCTVRSIAAGLTAEGVPTARGGAVWASSSVQAVLRSQAASAWAGLA